MVYFGKSVHLSHDLMDLRDEVKVFQQHCGGENLCVYKGKLREGEVFQFVSRRHQGFPFSLTLFLNGLQVDRLSSCCEFKHRKGARLGGRHGHFGFCGVEGASPCYKCIIAMGLDKKPAPPQKRVKEALPTSKSSDAKDATEVNEDIEKHDMSQEMETEPNGETTRQKKTQDVYEEDFEADDEGPVEDGDEVEEDPSTAANGGEKETKYRDEKEKSNSDSDVASMSKVKRSPSVSSGRTSSLSSSDNDNSEREIVEDTREVTAADVPEESIHAEEVITTAEAKPAETEATESSDVTFPQAAAQDSRTQDSPGDGMEKSDLEMSEDTDKKEGAEGEQSGGDAKPEDKPQENETERAKSMQEKLAETILKESQCSSEPEFSDTSTEEHEGASVSTQQDGQGIDMAEMTRDDILDESEANTQEVVCEERAHDDDEKCQPAEETNAQEPHLHTEEEVQEINERVKEQSESTNEAKQQDKREGVKTETEVTEDIESRKGKESLVHEPETHAEMLDTENTDTEVSEMEEEGQASQRENGQGTGAGDTERQRDADDVEQNIERRSDEQTDRDERGDLADEDGVDRSTGEMVQEKDDKVDDGEVEDGEKSSEDKAEEKLEVISESLGKEESENPRDEETQDECGDNLSAEEKENEDSTEKDEDGVNDEHKGGEVEELSSEIGNRLNDPEDVQDVRTQDNEKEEDALNDEQARNKLGVEAEEEGQEKPKSGDDNGGETEKVTDKTLEDGAQKEEEEAEIEDKNIDETAEGADGNCVENELKTGEKLVEEPKKEVTDMNKISENTLEAGGGKKEVVSDENTGQKLEVNFEDQNEESVSQEEQNEIGSRGAPDDDTEASTSTKEEVSEPAGVNNDLLDSNRDAENGERQDVSLEEAEKVEYLQEETQGKSEGETTGDRAQDVIDDNEKPETDKDVKEEEKHDDNGQEIENKSDAELVPSERESQLGDEHDNQASDNQKADKEEADKESETSATTFIENVTSQITQETTNKDTENGILSADVKVQELNDSEVKGTDNELRSRDAPEVMVGDPVKPLERKVNSVNNDGGSSVSHSLKSLPVEKVKDPVLSINSDPAIHSAPLTKSVGVDLVSNWINIHQESRYFQTFIEPLDEESLISEETKERLNGDVLNATDAPTSTDIDGLDETLKSRDEIATPARKNPNESTESVIESMKTETKAEAIEADAHSNHSKDSIHTSTKEEGVQEAGYTKGSLVTIWSRQSNDEQTNQKDIAVQETSVSDDVINLGTTATSEDIQEHAPCETEHQDVPTNVDLNGKESERSKQQNMTDETTHLSQTEEASNKETLESSEHNLQPTRVSQTECIEPQSPTITVITDLTIINKTENGSQDDTASVDFHSRQSDGNRRTEAIDGHLKQTLSNRDTLSTFSLDDARFFGPAGYPRLMTAHTENSY